MRIAVGAADPHRRRAVGAARRQDLDARGDRRRRARRRRGRRRDAGAPSGPERASLYAAALLAAPRCLRGQPRLWARRDRSGCSRVVWGADTFAFFGGRLIGGPRLWPRVSPGKTWSGAIVGDVRWRGVRRDRRASLPTPAACASRRCSGSASPPRSSARSAISPSSAIKRRFTVKDFEPPDPRPRRRSRSARRASSPRRFSPRWSAGRAAAATGSPPGLFHW